VEARATHKINRALGQQSLFRIFHLQPPNNVL
jgi:hypothetical protein